MEKFIKHSGGVEESVSKRLVTVSNGKVQVVFLGSDDEFKRVFSKPAKSKSSEAVYDRQ